MYQPFYRSRGLFRSLVLVGALALPSCQAQSGQWSFAVSRSVYGESGTGVNYNPGSCSGGAGGEAWGFLVIALLPVAVDLIFLPVALTHDVCD